MPEKKKTHRPPGVVLVGRLHVLQGLFRMGVGLFWFVMNDRVLGGLAAWPQGLAPIHVIRELAGWSGVILHGIFLVAAGVGLLRLRPRAWIWSMALQGIGLTAGLAAYLRGRPDYIAMAAGVIIVLLLNQHDVQAAFQRDSAASAEVRAAQPQEAA